MANGKEMHVTVLLGKNCEPCPHTFSRCNCEVFIINILSVLHFLKRRKVFHNTEVHGSLDYGTQVDSRDRKGHFRSFV
jgi:hypothetical protein